LVVQITLIICKYLYFLVQGAFVKYLIFSKQ